MKRRTFLLGTAATTVVGTVPALASTVPSSATGSLTFGVGDTVYVPWTACYQIHDLSVLHPDTCVRTAKVVNVYIRCVDSANGEARSCTEEYDIRFLDEPGRVFNAIGFSPNVDGHGWDKRSLYRTKSEAEGNLAAYLAELRRQESIQAA